MTLEHIASELQFWARRYAEGRQSIACSAVNDLTEKLLELGVECKPETVGERKGSIWAYDGDARMCAASKLESSYGKDGKKKEKTA